MKKILLALILTFSFSTASLAERGEVIDKYTEFLKEQQVEPVKKANDGYLDRLWRYFGSTKKEKDLQLQEDRLKRANDALKNLHKFELRK